MCKMDYPKFVLSNQMEESISIQRVKQSVISIDFSGFMELSEKIAMVNKFFFHSFELRANSSVDIFSYSGPPGILGSDEKH